ncbi:MAG: prepilin-type N-terminal cleavage/methylation domain-containing protein [Desulfobulbales bacterium]|nr:prepilin-type N-terminal cleavage/methylation domain-containing protein [Desulfobulbales bacterium]
MFDNPVEIRGGAAQKGVTLIELLVAMVLLAMVTSMLYSVLNVGIKFSRKGEDRLAALAVERSLLEVLHRQVHGAWYDKAKKKVMISAERDMLKVVTSSPLMERDAGLVLAVYWYDSGDRVLYYTEKLDFYNIDYAENYSPSVDEMVVLLWDVDDLDWQFDESEGFLTIAYLGNSYELSPRAWQSGDRL